MIQFRKIFQINDFSNLDLFSLNKINYSLIVHVFLFSLAKKKNPPQTLPEKDNVCTSYIDLQENQYDTVQNLPLPPLLFSEKNRQ